MTKLEKTVEALRRCVPAADFDAAMNEVEREAATTEAAPVESMSLELLTELGAPASLKGHPYIVAGLTMLVEKPELIHAVTKKLYPTIAERCGTTPARVERAIRHVIEVCWDRGEWTTLIRYFGNTVSDRKGKPTNAEFLAQLANIIRQKMKEG